MTTSAPTATSNEEPTRTSNPRGWLAAGIITPFVLLLLGYWSVRDVNAAQSGSLGLIEVLPASFFAVIGLLAVSFVIQLRRAETNVITLIAHVIALIFLFHGTVSWIEQSPRFPVTYTHLGFVDYIQRTNHTLPSLDARMSWPGFFSMGAMLDKIAGVNTAYQFLLWAPLLFNLTYAALIYAIARALTNDRRVPWVVVWLFFSISWVGQDYFSPQAVNFQIFLAFMAILLHCFRTDRAALPRPFRSIGARISTLVKKVVHVENLKPGGAPILPTDSMQRALLVFALVVMYGASVVSHQLTPFFILLEVIILVILRRIALRGFPLLLIVLVFSYISYGAIGFWSGHAKDIFGGFGQVTAVAQQNVGSKVQSEGHNNHVYVIYGRLALSGLLWITAGLGVLRRLRKGRTDIFALVCFLAPFLVLGGQSYGGEAILRVFLFSLPFATVFAVFALLPTEAIKLNAVRSILIVLVATLLGPAFMLARFGNEQFEYVSKNEYAAILKLYEIAPPGAQLVGIDANNAWRIKNVEAYRFSGASDAVPLEDINAVYQEMAKKGTRNSFLFVSRIQLQSIAVAEAKPADWGENFEQQLVASHRFFLVYENPDGAIYSLTPPTNQAAKGQS